MDRERVIRWFQLPVFVETRARVGYIFTLFVSIAVFLLMFNPFELTHFEKSSIVDSAMRSIFVAVVFSATTALSMNVIFIRRIKSGLFRSYDYVTMCLISVFTTSLIFSIGSQYVVDYVNSYITCSKVSVIPYTIATLFAIIRYMGSELLRRRQEVAASQIEMIPFEDDSGRVVFYQERDSVLYIEANDNYIKIYSNNGTDIVMRSIRCRMVSIEKQLSDKGFARCHRSYIINTRLLLMLKRDKKKYFAQLKNCDFEVPVSVTFAPILMEKLENSPLNPPPKVL